MLSLLYIAIIGSKPTIIFQKPDPKPISTTQTKILPTIPTHKPTRKTLTTNPTLKPTRKTLTTIPAYKPTRKTLTTNPIYKPAYKPTHKTLPNANLHIPMPTRSLIRKPKLYIDEEDRNIREANYDVTLRNTLDTTYNLQSDDLSEYQIMGGNDPRTYTGGGYTASQKIPAYRYHTTYDPNTDEYVQSGPPICVGNCGSSQNCTFIKYRRRSCDGSPISQLFDGTESGTIGDIDECKLKCKNDPDCNAFNVVRGGESNKCYWKNIDIENLDENIEENRSQDCHVCFDND